MDNSNQLIWAVFWVSLVLVIVSLRTDTSGDTEDQKKNQGVMLLIALLGLIVTGITLRDELLAWARELGRSLPWN
jgi:hypothetical protein